jgi:XTP/dITP diphosphohydrolase
LKVVIATSNQGKLREFETLLAPLNWQFYSLQDLGIDSPVEDGATFYDNAVIKAKHAATISGFPAIADDSGLCVDTLKGAPGIKSARFAGENSSDADNNLKLLNSLENETRRNAAFVACLVFFDPNSNEAPLSAEGRLKGEIAKNPKGEDGFGYDPIFFISNENKTLAELGKDYKNKNSHRAKATKILLKKLLKEK